MAFEIGNKIGDYEVIGVLGTGGMGKVYKVRNTISERIEAMKVLLPDLAHDPDLEGRFLREIKLLATLDHPNIASLRTALRIENQLLMIMEFVEGTTLAQRLQQGPLPLGETADYVCQVLSALSYAHARGVIHRDIKPANMMLTPGRVVKLMDFGIAKATADPKMTVTGQTLGSLSYMSPEQVKAEALDARSDIYSLGVSLYELVTGKRPFKEDSDYALMAAHLQKTPVPPIQLDPGLPPALNEIILMAMAKDAGSRFQSAAAFQNALESVKSTLQPLGAATTDVGSAATTATAMGPTALLGGASQGLAPASASGVPPAPAGLAGEGFTAPLVSRPHDVAPPATFPPTSPPQAAPAQVPPLPAAPVSPPQSAPARSYRGFYMTAGALVAIAVLVIGATQFPKWHKAKAGGSAPPMTPDVSTPAPSSTSPAPASPGAPSDQSSAGQPVAGQPGQPPPAAGPPSVDQSAQAPAPNGAEKAPLHNLRGLKPGGKASVPQAAGGSRPASPAATPTGGQAAAAASSGNAEQLKELRHRLTLLAARARAVKSSFERLQQQQQAQGVSPRQDMAAALERMDQLMDQALDALGAGDAASAQESMDSAEREVERLEKFFGG